MVHLTKKSKIAIIAIVAFAIVVMITVPFVSAQEIADSTVCNLKTFTAQGNVYKVVDNETIKYYPASLALTLEPIPTNGSAKGFTVVDGTLTANGVSYPITGGQGVVLTGRHAVLLLAEGTSPKGEAVTLKIVGFYAYSWNQGQTVLRIGAKLLTENGNYTLLLKTAI